MLGLIVDFSDRYVVTSNRESGFGRYDVTLESLRPDKDDGISSGSRCSSPERKRS